MREPAPTKTASDAERASGISDTSTRTPFGRTRFSYSKVANASRAGGSSRLRDVERRVAHDELRTGSTRSDKALSLERRGVSEVLVGIAECVLIGGAWRSDRSGC